jgi:hypothetical protein
MKPLFALALAALSMLSLRQNTTPLGTITGIVRDSAGATIPGVTVRATGPGEPKVTVTDEKGSYLLRVAPGIYKVEAILRGFESFMSNLEVRNSEQTVLNVTLQIGPLRQQGSLIPRQFARDRDVSITGDSVTAQGSLIQYRKNVQLNTESVHVRADEIDFDTVSRTASLRGNVSLLVLSVSPRTVPLSN